MSKLGALLAVKRALMEAKGYEARPWFHGTNTDIVLDARPVWAAEDPMVASLYTGGGRRAGPGTAKSGGRLYPLVARQGAQDTGLTVTAPVQRSSNEWLERMGIDNPTEFRRQVLERAEAKAAQQPKFSHAIPYASDLGEVGMHVPSYNPLTYNPKLYEVLDHTPFLEQLIETLGPGASFIFDHPSSVLRFDARGRKRVGPDMENASVLFAPQGKGALSSVFDFKRGGRV